MPQKSHNGTNSNKNVHLTTTNHYSSQHSSINPFINSNKVDPELTDLQNEILKPSKGIKQIITECDNLNDMK